MTIQNIKDLRNLAPRNQDHRAIVVPSFFFGKWSQSAKHQELTEVAKKGFRFHVLRDDEFHQWSRLLLL